MDIQGIISCLKERSFENLIICGAGYTGVEVATNLWRYLKKRGLLKKIIIVERAPEILGVLPDWMKDYVVENLKSMGIEVLINSVIEKIQAEMPQGQSTVMSCMPTSMASRSSRKSSWPFSSSDRP